MEEGVQRVFLSHTSHHHEVSDGAFGVCDQGVCPVQGSAEVLHFQDRAPLRQQHNGRCLGRVSNDFSATRRASALAEATFELASCDPARVGSDHSARLCLLCAQLKPRSRCPPVAEAYKTPETPADWWIRHAEQWRTVHQTHRSILQERLKR